MSAIPELSFFSRVKSELKMLFAHAPSWEVSAAATLTYVAPMVEAIATLADPAAAPTVSDAIARVQAAMAAASVLIKAAGPTPTLVKYLHAVIDNAANLEVATGSADPQTKAKLQLLVSTITAEVNAILNEVSPIAQAG